MDTIRACTHIVFILAKADALAILAGHKTCEARLFKSWSHPAQDCAPGDTLIFRCRALGGVFARSTVTRIESFVGLTPERVERLAKRYTRVVDGPVMDAPFWAAKAHARTALFIHFARAHHHCVQVTVPAGPARWGWVVLDQDPPVSME